VEILKEAADDGVALACGGPEFARVEDLDVAAARIMLRRWAHFITSVRSGSERSTSSCNSGKGMRTGRTEPE
jgi:hypothetical protein